MSLPLFIQRLTKLSSQSSIHKAFEGKAERIKPRYRLRLDLMGNIIPQELLDTIVDNLRLDPDSLYSLCLTSRRFLHYAR